MDVEPRLRITSSHGSGAVLGAGAAITSKLAQLQETARSLAVPDHVRANISANLANARDLMGLGDGAGSDAAGGSAGPAETLRASPGGLEPIAEQPSAGGGAGPAAAEAAPDSGSALSSQNPCPNPDRADCQRPQSCPIPSPDSYLHSDSYPSRAAC